MLETGSVLSTWQIMEKPEEWGEQQNCRKLSDHRIQYLTYEGPISGNRGEVRIEDRGIYEILEKRGNIWRIRLCGGTMVGILELVRHQNDIWMYRFQGDLL